MTKIKKCRHISPSWIDRFVMWFGGKPDLHNWNFYRKQNEHAIYYCRKCECGANEVQNAGPMGDGKWRDVNSPFRQQWEKDMFDTAETLNA